MYTLQLSLLCVGNCQNLLSIPARVENMLTFYYSVNLYSHLPPKLKVNNLNLELYPQPYLKLLN